MSLLQAEVLRRAIKDFAIVCAGNALCLIKSGQRGLRAGMRRYGFLNVDCSEHVSSREGEIVHPGGLQGRRVLGSRFAPNDLVTREAYPVLRNATDAGAAAVYFAAFD